MRCCRLLVELLSGAGLGCACSSHYLPSGMASTTLRGQVDGPAAPAFPQEKRHLQKTKGCISQFSSLPLCSLAISEQQAAGAGTKLLQKGNSRYFVFLILLFGTRRYLGILLEHPSDAGESCPSLAEAVSGCRPLACRYNKAGLHRRGDGDGLKMTAGTTKGSAPLPELVEIGQGLAFPCPRAVNVLQGAP